MNLLLVESLSSDSIRILGKAAQALLIKHRFTVGNVINVGEINGPVMQAEIIGLSADEINLKISKDKETVQLAKQPIISISIILALPRPQTLKKVFEYSGCVGIKNIYLTASDRVEKSYFTSSVLREDERKKYLELGMTQGVSTHMPRVTIGNSLGKCLEIVTHEHLAAIFLLAHPYSADKLSDLKLTSSAKQNKLTEIVLAIGPEAGWTENEISCFEKNHFNSIKSGDKILRVEHAVCSIVSQLHLLNEINYNHTN